MSIALRPPEALQTTDGEARPKLVVRDLKITFEDQGNGLLTEAVGGVSLSMQPGEFVTIVGLSGCGKTTFLNAVAGLVSPTSGEIAINGKPVKGPGPDRTVVFQKPSLLPWRNVLGNVSYGMELRGAKKSEIQDKARAYLEMVHLTGFEKHLPHQLSGGMQQRVNIARALVCEPEVLLLDEPFAALDAITRQDMQNELLALWEQTRKTVLLVTHQIDEAVLLSDRVIVFSSRPAQIVEEIRISLPRPRTPEVRDNPLFDHLVKRIWGLIHATSEIKEEPEYEI
ncbi:MAG: Taurine-transporting ATPase [Paenibacillaceae bacterium]|jgi:NitT/TauT family transport system ATP-binding protein|nr:Taurine-transporting ATPase [Paenibacillaceae bacterium]